MTSPEHQEYPEVKEAIESLNSAQEEEVSWESSDGEFLYRATPTSVLEDPTMPSPLAAWRLDRYARADDQGNVQMRTYILITGEPMSVTEFTLTRDILANGADDSQAFMDNYNKSFNDQVDQGLNVPEFRDYADLANALHDLIL